MTEESGVEMTEIDENLDPSSTGRVKPRRKKANVVFWVIVSSLLAVVLACGGWLFYHNSTYTKVPAAPGVVTFGQESAVCDVFASADLGCVSLTEINETVERGSLISQSAPVGKSLKKGEIVELHYSVGPEKVVLPELRNETVPRLQALIDPVGGTVVEKEIVNDTGLAEGRIVTSSIPAGGEIPNEGNVVVTISSGKLTVPTWRGQSVKKVESDALDAGIKVEFLELETDGPAGVVTEQTAEGLVPMDNVVTVNVSKTREPKDVIVPEVIGLKVEDAQGVIASYGFTSITVLKIIDPKTTDEIEGTVTLVNPVAGSKVKSNTPIDLTVASR